MAKYKTLKSVVHNFGHSFISLMNFYRNDYVLGHIQNQMLKTKIQKLEIDILNKKVTPQELLTLPIIESIENYINWFPKLVQDSKSEIGLIQCARLTIEFDLSKSRACSYSSENLENPFVCTSQITDIRGKEYRYEFKDWWFPEALTRKKLKPNLVAIIKNWILSLRR